jgi:hypothetical protein
MKSFIAFLGTVAFLFLAIGSGDSQKYSGSSSNSGYSSSGGGTSAQNVQPTDNYTASQRNAIRSAKSYLQMKGFSKAGLINQLSSEYGEGFPKADAVFAVNHIEVDWNEQAYRSAKSYLQMKGFSRSGLIQQLTSEHGEGFTQAQAEYGVTKAGL